MAYDINDADVAKFIRDEKAEMNARRGTGRWRPTREGLRRLAIEGQKGAFGVGRLAFYPSDLPGLVGWYRSDNGVSIDSSTMRLRAWKDLSAAGNPALPFRSPTQPQPPVLVANAWDGKPVVRFTRANPQGEGLILDHFISAMTGASVFVVMRLNSVPLNNGDQFRVFSGGLADPPDPHRFICYVFNNGGAHVLRMFAGTAALGTHEVSVAARHICSYVFNGATSRMRLDMGGDDAATVGANDCTGWSIGADAANTTTDADFAEMLIYNRAVTTTEQATIESYLSQQWSAV